MTKRAREIAARLALSSFALVLAVPTAHAAFPGRNGVIVFADSLPGDGAIIAIFSVSPDGTNLRQLTKGTDLLGEFSPAVSPDGTRIAFMRETNYTGDIWVMNIDGSDQRQLTFGKSLTKPAWSPDGKQIAVAASGSGGIGVMNADGSDLHMLRTDNSDDPRWSPDGTLLSFMVATVEGGWDVYVMRPDGSDVRRLTDTPEDDFAADWSPDGSQLTFDSSRRGSAGLDIYRMRVDGSAQKRVVSMPEFDVNPVWSPDGKRIAWERCTRSATQEDLGIYSANVDGSDVRKIATILSCTGTYPDWQALPGPRTVAIDISPHDDDDVVVLHGRDAVQVAFLSQDGFDARSIDPSTACFGAAGDVDTRDCFPRRRRDGLTDVDGDGDLDLLLTFRGRQSGLTYRDTHACASASTSDGEEVEGCRDVEVIARWCW